jgi:hypothetical protein
MDAYPIADFNSLIRQENSLFLKLFSLLIRLREIVEKSLRDKGLGVDTVSASPKTGDFPCKIPC